MIHIYIFFYKVIKIKKQCKLFVVQSVIDGNIKVNLSEVFYQFSPIERTMVLKAIKEGRLETKMDELNPKLTPGEQNFISKDDKI